MQRHVPARNLSSSIVYEWTIPWNLPKHLLVTLQFRPKCTVIISIVLENNIPRFADKRSIDWSRLSDYYGYLFSLLYRWLTSDRKPVRRLSTTVISGDHPSRRRRKVDNLNKVNVGIDLSENSHVWIPFTYSMTEICISRITVHSKHAQPAHRTSFRYAKALHGYTYCQWRESRAITRQRKFPIRLGTRSGSS